MRRTQSLRVGPSDAEETYVCQRSSKKDKYSWLGNHSKRLLRTTTYPLFFPEYDKNAFTKRVRSARTVNAVVAQEEQACKANPSLSSRSKPPLNPKESYVTQSSEVAIAKGVLTESKKQRSTTPKSAVERIGVSKHTDLLRIREFIPVRGRSTRSKCSRPLSRPSSSYSSPGQAFLDSLEMKLLCSPKYSSSLPGSYFSTPGTALKLASRVYGVRKS